MQRWKRSGMLFGLLLPLAGCSSDSPVEPSLGGLSPSGPPIRAKLFVEQEGEFLGDVFDGNARSTSDSLFFQLAPLDAATDSLLPPSFKEMQWLRMDSTSRMPIEYFHPSGGSQCGGTLAAYLAGNTGTEFHRAGPGAGDPSGPEGHCIIPGRYTVSLFQGAAGGVPLKTFGIDYVQTEPGASAEVGLLVDYPASPFGLPTSVESVAFDANNDVRTDFFVNFHLNPDSTFSDNPVLDIQNSGSNPASTTFADQTSPRGTALDFFRYGVERSTSTWHVGTADDGRALSRIYWNGPNPAEASGFFDSHSISRYLRIHQYTDVTSVPTTVAVGLEIKRPDEDPDTGPSITRDLLIDGLGVSATFDTEFPGVEKTWQLTDQVFDASGSSSGPNIRYSWEFEAGVGFGPESADPTIEFDGHSTVGGKRVTVRVRDIGITPPVSDEFFRTIQVSTGLVAVSGPTLVLSKKPPSVYTSSQVGDWHERNLIDNGPAWILSSENSNSLTRIWAAGVYTVEVRSSDTVSAQLRRGRLSIDICIAPGCAATSVRPNFSVSGQPAGEGFGIFGAGPWISAGGTGNRQLARFYDLTGLHDNRSPFGDVSWMDAPKGSARAENGQWDVQWTKLDLDTLNAVAARLKVVPQSRTAPYVFGMAVDPDLGRWPSDDLSGYDPATGLLHVRDSEKAVGILLLRGARNAISRVQQYGANPSAPRTMDRAWEANRRDGINLDTRSGDVQFILSAGQDSGVREWTFVVIRAADLSQLRRRANRVLTALGATN